MDDTEQRRGELEENAIVLDYMPTGRSFSARSEPLVQLIGENRFTLLEAIPKVTNIKVEERVYIGKGDREKISLIKSRITFNELTEGAKNEIYNAIYAIIKGNEKRFIELFNTASPLNIRMHSLELLPGIGKKHLNAILAEREKQKFESFADLTNRVPMLQDPIKLLVERVVVELKGESRFYVLSRPYSPHQDDRDRDRDRRR